MTQPSNVDVTVRVEPGSLGPDGKDHVEMYCRFAQKAFDKYEAKYANWNIIPRYDKTLPELELSLSGKKLTDTQSNKYLELFDEELDELEERVMGFISNLIDKYLGHKY